MNQPWHGVLPEKSLIAQECTTTIKQHKSLLYNLLVLYNPLVNIIILPIWGFPKMVVPNNYWFSY